MYQNIINEHFQVNIICIGRFLVKVEFNVTLIYTDDAITIRIDFFKVFFFLQILNYFCI